MNRNKYTEQELLQARERNNKSRKYKNDSVWQSTQCGSFSIIGRFDNKYLYIKFLNTNAIYKKHSTSVASGNVKDLYSPTVYNKGFFGEGEYSSISHRPIYNRWTGILERLYSGRCPTYSDCAISEDWLNFQNFARDIETLMREKGIDSLDGYEIDKDLKSNGVKIYSKKTVTLVTRTENNEEMNSRVHNTVYIAENIGTGEKIEFTNQAQFAKEHGLNASNISSVLTNRYKLTGDWTFYIKGEKAPDISSLRDTIYIAENLTTGETIEFTNQAQFAREHGINPSSISSVLNCKTWSTGDFTFYKKGDEPRKKEYTIYIAENIKTGEKIEFTNQSEFAREYGLNASNISLALNGKLKATGGWIFYKKGDKAPDICVYVAENVKTGEIVEFTNQRQFAREHNIGHNHIPSVVNGKRKTTGGWKFRRKEEPSV